MTQADVPAPRRPRLEWLDQMRGYAIFGMLLVNAKGVFGLELEQLKHHREAFTYADTIAPLFVFVVGIGMRLSWLRRTATAEAGQVRAAMFRRYGLLVLIAFAIYTGWLWDALMDIGLAGLLAIPLIACRPRIRIGAAFLMAALYQAACMLTIYGQWVTRAVKLDETNMPLLIRLLPLRDELFGVALNGGPLGPLSWCMILLFGTVVYDWVAAGSLRSLAARCLLWGGGLCAFAWALSLPWSSVKAAWPFSAYYMTAPFPLLATGLCLLHLLAFYLLCDRAGVRIPTLSEVGMNPLVVYIASSLVLDVVEGFEPALAAWPIGILAFAAFYGLFAVFAVAMKRRGVFIRA